MPQPSPSAPPTGDTPPTRFRSGAVARMLGMPVATLRVWERRYGLSQAALTPSGQRLYTAADVHRLALIKQLSERGHAIGSLAKLNPAQLQEVAATHAQVLAGRHEAPTSALPVTSSSPTRVVLIGQGWPQRLQAWACGPDDALLCLGPFEDAGAAEAALLPNEAVDLVLIQLPQLHPGFLDSWRSLAPSLSQQPTALLYRFGADALCQSLTQAGLRLLREPQPHAVCKQWFQDALARPVTSRAAANPVKSPAPIQTQDLTPPPRRWSDAALADFAGLSTTVACECPRHLAELLMQMSHFETYSAQCESLSPADAALHRHLWQLAADCRARFEAALEHVARHEGLLLPRR